jgi:putative chitinase
MVTSAILRAVFPLCSDPEGWTTALAPALVKYEINSRRRMVSFLAQTGYESGQFNRLEEGLSYSTVARLRKVWPKRFPTDALAAPFVGKAKLLANFVYANRLGNGSASSGDGYKYRGRGIMQLTGKSNYASATKELGVDFLNSPELALTMPNAAMIAAWFWSSRGLNALADDRTDDDDLEDFRAITIAINGGVTGLQARLALLNELDAKLA